MANFYDRVNELCSRQGMSITALAVELGLSKGTPTNWKKMTQPPRRNTLKAVADYFGVSVEYLTSEEKEKASDVKSNAMFLDNSSVRMVPLYESVSAGFGVNALEEIVGYMPCYIENPYEAENTMCLKVWGDSMSPKIENGDVIQVVKQNSVDSGSIAVVLLDGEEGLVKRVVYGKSFIELHSINPAYPVRRFEGAEVLRVSVVGLVRTVIKKI
ncbi:MAG: helix-turn-helix transcriptional regulator [Clostridia bacterium]|nr:helix-turn-helix transcriptional regulator [Clostridia bacterium]